LKVKRNKGVVISARVHPGESVGSWMMKGVLDFLTSDCIEAKALRKLFIFKVIPMMNPDGVINGNYRCSLSGGDLNRRWKAPSKMLHPTVYETKKLCREFQKERELTLFWDLHGHSRKKNIFMYGNNINDDPSSTRMFPYIMSKLTDFFSFSSSKFSMTKSKETTARISLYRELQIPCIYTMEASFWGADQGELEGLHFNAVHFNKIGRNLLHALILFCKINPHRVMNEEPQVVESEEKCEEEENKPLDFENIFNEFKEKQDELVIENDSGSSAGSDSEPSADNMSDDEIAKILPVKTKKKKKKILTQNSFKKRNKELEIRLREKNRKREEQEKAKKSPMKRISNYKNVLKDRFNLSRINKVKMVDNWTQTSNRGSDTEKEEKKESVKREDAFFQSKTTENTFYSGNPDDSPLSLYQRNNPSTKYKISMNTALSTNKTFRSPVANSIANDYRKKEYNTSFSLSKSKGRLFNKTNFESSDSFKHSRHNSSHYDNLGERFAYAQRQVRKSPQKAYVPASHENSSSLL